MRMSGCARQDAPFARRARGTARGRGYQLRPDQRAARAAVSVLRRPHDRHRDVPARLLAALPALGIHRRDQDRHIMIRPGSRRHSSAALLLRRLSTSNDHARRRAALDNRLVDQSRPRNAGSAYRDRPSEPRHTFERSPKRRSTHLGNTPQAPKFP